MLKYASAKIMTSVLAPRNAGARELRRFAHRHHFSYKVRPGYLYVRSRAISSRCNDNFDRFPAEELEKSWRTFIGKPVFVNHHNDDHRRARGVIIDAALHRDSNRDGTKDYWVELLHEVDAIRFPKLAQEIINGNIARTSMGCDVAFSVCSACGNKATTPAEYCAHIPASKGVTLYRTTASGQKVGEIIHETCYGLKFFENSLLVEPPADPTAFFLGVDTRGMEKAAAASVETAAHALPYQAMPGHAVPSLALPCPTLDGQRTASLDSVNSAFLYATAAKDPRFEGVSLDQDEDGYFVKTHRARSKSYASPEKIPQKDVDFIESTGARKTAGVGWTEGESMDWDSIGARHPHIYGDPEIHEGARGDGEGIGWAANQLAHSTEDDPEAENHGSWDLTFHSEHVDPRHIDFARHGAGDGRVQHATEGYRNNPDKVPPLVLVHRHGVYQVADGHHRAEAANLAGSKVRAYVAYSPYPNKPSGDGDKAPYHGAEETPGRQPQWEREHQTQYASRKTARRKHAYGEQKAPADVDTLREDACPVCGDRDTYDGATCQVCGYVAPPKLFQDPDLELARQMDLRKDIADFQDPANPNQLGPDGQPIDPQEQAGGPMDPGALDENGNPINPDAADPGAQPGTLPGEVQAEVQPGGDPMGGQMVGPDGTPLNPQGTPDELGAPVDPAMLGPDGQPLQQPGQQMMVGPDGMPIGPQELPAGATTNDGKPFTPGPNMPQGPGGPQGPEGVEGPLDPSEIGPDGQMPQDGQIPNPDAGQGVPGTPGDGVPDLQCPACGFQADATNPVSVDMDTALMPPSGQATPDGVQAGDICPNCGSAPLVSPAEATGQVPVPVTV